MPNIHGSLTDSEFIAFGKIAEKRGIKISELVKQIAVEEIKREEKK